MNNVIFEDWFQLALKIVAILNLIIIIILAAHFIIKGLKKSTK